MPIFEYMCDDCGFIWEIIEPCGDKTSYCSHCDKQTGKLLPSAFGGYTMNSGPSSVRPKNAGSFRRDSKKTK